MRRGGVAGPGGAVFLSTVNTSAHGILCPGEAPPTALPEETKGKAAVQWSSGSLEKNLGGQE